MKNKGADQLCADVHAGLKLCCLHTEQNQGFLTTRSIKYIEIVSVLEESEKYLCLANLTIQRWTWQCEKIVVPCKQNRQVDKRS